MPSPGRGDARAQPRAGGFPVLPRAQRGVGGVRGAEAAKRDSPGLPMLWVRGESRELRWDDAGKDLGTPCYGLALGKEPVAGDLFSSSMHYINTNLLLFEVLDLLIFIVLSKT